MTVSEHERLVDRLLHYERQVRDLGERLRHAREGRRALAAAVADYERSLRGGQPRLRRSCGPIPACMGKAARDDCTCTLEALNP